VGSARFGDAWGCRCSNCGRSSRAKLGPACGEGQRGGLGDSGRPGAGLGRACRATATGRGPAAAASASAGTATCTRHGTRRRSTRADLGSPGDIGSACRTHRSGGSDLGCCSPGPATATGTRAILGCTWSRCAGRAAGPDMGLASAWSQRVSAASAAVVGCAQARSPTRAGRAVLGQ
jgi:hypothetical protein